MLRNRSGQFITDKRQRDGVFWCFRERNFALFGATYYAIAQTLTPDFVQQRHFVTVLRVTHQIVQETAVGGAVEVTLRRDVVNGDGIPPRQNRQCGAFFGLSAHAEQRHQALKRQRDIQVVTTHAATAVA
ncbi:hypothetical protein D3C72_1511300 [compost metagenome]